MEIRHSTVIVYVHENGIWPFQGLLILRIINITLLRRILSEPVFSGHPVLSRQLEGSRGCPLKTGLTVVFFLLLLCFLAIYVISVNLHYNSLNTKKPWIR